MSSVAGEHIGRETHDQLMALVTEYGVGQFKTGYEIGTDTGSHRVHSDESQETLSEIVSILFRLYHASGED